MTQDMILISIGYGTFFAALLALFGWTLVGQKSLRAKLARLDDQIASADKDRTL